MRSKTNSDATRSLLAAVLAVSVAGPRGTVFAKCRPEYQNLPGGLVHTACKPPNPNCISVEAGLSEADKAEVLKAHNDYRSQVAMGKLPGFQPAKNMYRMKWDDELAEVAQAFSDLCDDSGHDDKQARITLEFKETCGEPVVLLVVSVSGGLSFCANYESIRSVVKWVKDFCSVRGSAVTGDKCLGFWHGEWHTTPANFVNMPWVTTSVKYLGVPLEKYRDTKFDKVGQNLAYNYEPTQTSTVDAAGRVKDWFDEYKDFNPGFVDPFQTARGPAVLHFTQVAWAETRYVGCGYTHYKLRADNQPQFPFKKLFACNYAPGGNILQTSMYKIGKACSECPSGTSCDEATGLCHTPGDSDGIGESVENGGGGSLWLLAGVLLVGGGLAVIIGGLVFMMKGGSAEEGV